MLAITHLLLVLILITWFGLDRKAAFATLLFGVLIDLDHTLGMVEFVAREGWQNALNLNAALTSDVQWKSLLHSPQGVLFVAPVVLASRMVIPLVAWAAHLVMDHVQIYYLGICSPVEIVLLLVMLVVLVKLRQREYAAVTGDDSLKGLLISEGDRALALVDSVPVLRSVSRWIAPRGNLG